MISRRKSPTSSRPLDRSFYDRDPVVVARELLGKRLVTKTREGVSTGRIVEVEAYLSADDPACHAARGMTKRNASMFAPPGLAYVYSIHSRWCFNVVTLPEGVGSAVLIRAVEPLDGLALMHERRAGVERVLDLARGPARLCQALGIDRGLDGHDLTRGRRLWIENGGREPFEVLVTPRIGISCGQDLPLRFLVAGSAYVSKRWFGVDRSNGRSNGRPSGR
jgi:DNA-3-methyladenine glycosylase